MSKHLPPRQLTLSNATLIKRLFRLTKPHWPWLLTGIVLSLVTLLANIALLSVSGWFITAMAAAGIAGVSMNYFTPSGVIRFLAIVRTAGRYGERMVTHNATFLILADLRTWFYQQLEPLAPAGLHAYRSSDLLARLQQDIEQLDNFYLRIALPIIVALIALPILLSTAYVFYPLLAAILAFSLSLVGFILPLWVAKRTNHQGARIAQQQQKLTTAVIDGLQSIREFEIYAANSNQHAYVMQCSDGLCASQTAINKINALAQSVSVAVVNLTLIASFIVLAQAVADTLIPKSQLVMLLLFSLAVFEAVQPLPLAFEYLSSTLASAKRLFSLADQTPVRAEPKQPYKLDHLFVNNGFDINIKNLHFHYPNSPNTEVITGLNLKVKQGEKIAIAGASGSGKSTLVNILQGFYPCPSHSVQLGNIDINDYSGENLRANLALVSQNCYLFCATLRDNLLLANPHASDEQIKNACDFAHATEFIEQLPDKLDTWLGETGRGLSGGQARRIHLAQALLKDAPVLILDEPTEGLDTITEQLVISAIWELMADKTVILITHNPRLLQAVDRVYTL